MSDGLILLTECIKCKILIQHSWNENKCSGGLKNLVTHCNEIRGIVMDNSDTATEAMQSHFKALETLSDEEIKWLKQQGIMDDLGQVFKTLLSRGARVKVT